MTSSFFNFGAPSSSSSSVSSFPSFFTPAPAAKPAALFSTVSFPNLPSATPAVTTPAPPLPAAPTTAGPSFPFSAPISIISSAHASSASALPNLSFASLQIPSASSSASSSSASSSLLAMPASSAVASSASSSAFSVPTLSFAGTASSGGPSAVSFAAGASQAGAGGAAVVNPLDTGGKTVGWFLSVWPTQLEDLISAFSAQAKEVKQWDDALFANQQKIEELRGNVTRIQAAAAQLDSTVQTIDTSLQELETLITQLEAKAKELVPSVGASPDDLKRDSTYAESQLVDQEMRLMDSRLQNTIETLNKATDKQLDARAPITKVLKVLNNHFASLLWIDSCCADLEGKMDDAGRALQDWKQTKQ